jgi:hypothetical protein
VVSGNGTGAAFTRGWTVGLGLGVGFGGTGFGGGGTGVD